MDVDIGHINGIYNLLTYSYTQRYQRHSSSLGIRRSGDVVQKIAGCKLNKTKLKDTTGASPLNLKGFRQKVRFSKQFIRKVHEEQCPF